MQVWVVPPGARKYWTEPSDEVNRTAYSPRGSRPITNVPSQDVVVDHPDCTCPLRGTTATSRP